MRPIAALATLFLAAGAAAAQTACPTSADGLSRPLQASGADWVYTEGPDRVVVSGAPSWIRHHALGG